MYFNVNFNVYFKIKSAFVGETSVEKIQASLTPDENKGHFT